ncbi:hypothetical protein GH733_007098 [Mirounga leonina]|nr:hypothetical protein GH733_007098 [Mirounga leonina]
MALGGRKVNQQVHLQRKVSFSVFHGCLEDAGYKVSISGTTVVLICPEEVEGENLQWEMNGEKIPEANEKQLSLAEFSEVEHSGYYACYADVSKKNYLYLKARVCRNCMEVDVMAVVAIIIADICITLGLGLLVYYYSKNRKANAMPVMRARGAGGKTRGKTMELHRKRVPPRGGCPAWARMGGKSTASSRQLL